MLTWFFFLVYAVATAALAIRSSLATEDARSFALGSGHMHWALAGITLGACLASSATFVIAPGFVYAEGLPALIGFSLPLIAGIATGLFGLAYRFQRTGRENGALTVPHWIGARYDSVLLRRFYSGLNILNLAYLVMITVGCAYVMSEALGLPYAASVVGIVVFVFGYTAFGGATAHAWTNSLQGVVMLGVAVAIFFSGSTWWPEVTAALSTDAWTAPASPLFSTATEVWGVPFLMGVALSSQPHLLSKALYVEGTADLTKALVTAVISFSVFSLVLVAGLYARFAFDSPIPQDQVMARYLQVAFSHPAAAAAVSVAVLAAAMSTMDGLLVAIGASVANDLFGGNSVAANRLVLFLLAVVTIGLALQPPSLVLLLGQSGVYGLVVASAGPLLAGLFLRQRLPTNWAIASASAGLVLHFGIGAFVVNPGVGACVGLLVAVPLAFVPALTTQNLEVTA